VTYRSSLDSSTSIYRSKQIDASIEPQKLEIRVLSPAFFSRLIHYTHAAKAFDQESIFTSEMNRTVIVSRPDLLSRLFYAENQIATMQTQPSFLNRFRWSIQQRLRSPPVPPVSLLTTPDVHGKDLAVAVKDVDHITFSTLDIFVQSSCEDGWIYRRLCTQLFIARRLFGGLPDLVNLSDALLRLLLIFYGLRRNSIDGMVDFNIAVISALHQVMAVLVINAANIWAGLKGC
jgi:hypothetical protein